MFFLMLFILFEFMINDPKLRRLPSVLPDTILHVVVLISTLAG